MRVSLLETPSGSLVSKNKNSPIAWHVKNLKSFTSFINNFFSSQKKSFNFFLIALLLFNHTFFLNSLTKSLAQTTTILPNTFLPKDASLLEPTTDLRNAPSQIIEKPSVTATEIRPDTSELRVNFISLPSSISTPLYIKAQTNFKADNFIFFLAGPQNQEFPAEAQENNIYACYVNPAKFIAGTYTVTARATKGDQKAENTEKIILTKATRQDSFNIPSDIEKVPQTDFANTTTTNSASSLEGSLEINFSPPLPAVISLKENFKIQVSLSKPIDNINFEIHGNGILKIYPGIKINEKRYYCVLSKEEFSNAPADYEIKITAKIGENIFSTASNSQISGMRIADSSHNAPSADENNVKIAFGETSSSPLSGDAKISFSANKEVKNAYFVIEGNNSTKKYSAHKDSDTLYHFILPTKQFPNGHYKISAFASNEGTEISNSFEIDVKNMEKIAESKDTSLPLEINFAEEIKKQLSETKRITIFLNQTIDELSITLEGPTSKTFPAQKDGADYYFILPTKELPNGMYKLNVIALKNEAKYYKTTDIEVKNKISTDSHENKFPPECEQNNITSAVKCKEFLSLPPECRGKNITNQEECAIYVALPEICRQKEIRLKDACDRYISQTVMENSFIIATECKEKGLNEEHACQEFLSLLPECRKKNITTQNRCTRYMQESAEILPECKNNNIKTTDECKKYMAMPEVCRNKKLTAEECSHYLEIPPECQDKGLSKEECDKFLAIPQECRSKGILNKAECEKQLQKEAKPKECQEADTKTPEECTNILFLNNMPAICREKKALTKTECDKLLQISKECLNANILDFKECDKFMAQNFMPKECKENGLSTREECDLFLREKYNNTQSKITEEIKPAVGITNSDALEKISPECKDNPDACNKMMLSKNIPPECEAKNITDSDECEKYLISISLPEECQAADAKDKKECQKLLFQKNAPEDCLNEGIYNAENCQKFMFKKYAPAECREAGLLTEESCKNFMFEKYSGKNISLDSLPLECQKANIKTTKECDQMIKKLYFPPECKKQGIENEAECETYMEQKYMTKECREMGAKTRAECDQIMFKKFSPQECQEAGINNEKDCKEFLFNKYAPKIQCEGMDEWQCKNSIKERHLGNIIAKQAQSKELKDKISQLAGESVKIEDLGTKLNLAAGMIPLRKKEAGVKILTAEENLILDEEDNLINTSPIALMIDSDGDGLPDDLEARWGTNPQEADSDEDGYSDNVEIQANYNPLGTGEIKKALAPIDQAILDNKPLGQPKTEGEISDELLVSTIINKTNEETGVSEGYKLTGQAEPNSTVTLYIYSDLPLVITAKANEYGNWQYEINESLIEGQHEVYVVINDNTGRVLQKSNPVNFFVEEAKAVSVKDFISASTASTSSPEPTAKAKSLLNYYMIFAIALIIIGILIFIIFLIQKKKQTP